jgi:NAD(P)-dependent dehydrogenase (short-subunit alcohol dehydrogenase family)
MKNKTVLITGATSGIGKVAAMRIAGEGATLLFHGRNQEKADATKNEIIKTTGNRKVDYLLADLTSLQSVRQLAQDFKNKYSGLDILINNAGGIMNETREITTEGLEKTLVLNYLSPFLLSHLLFDLIKESPEGRIINTSSMAYNWAKPDFSDFQMEKKYTSTIAYGNAKLYLILFTIALAEKMRSAGVENVTVNALHPGVVRTNFSLDTDSRMKIFFKLFNRFLISPEKGADTINYLALDPGAKKLNGQFLKKRKAVKLRKDLVNDKNQKFVWEKSEVLTGVNWKY